VDRYSIVYTLLYITMSMETPLI